MNHHKKQSSFINTFSWIAIFFSGFGVLIGVMQNIMLQTVMKDTPFKHVSGEENVPPLIGMIFEHFDLLIMGMLILMIITFIASIGLLKRKNWARIFFISFLIMGIIWNVIGGFIQFSMLDSMTMGAVPQDIPAEFQNMQNMMKIVMAVMMVAMTAFYFYLIKRLRSTEIKEEFLV